MFSVLTKFVTTYSLHLFLRSNKFVIIPYVYIEVPLFFVAVAVSLQSQAIKSQCDQKVKKKLIAKKIVAHTAQDKF